MAKSVRKTNQKRNKTEAKLEKLGFVKKWFDDESGYWFEKPIKKLFKGNILNIKFIATVDMEYKTFEIEKCENKTYEDFLKFESLKDILKFINKNGKL